MTTALFRRSSIAAALVLAGTISLGPTLAAQSSAQPEPAAHQVTGTVAYLQRIALPPNAVVKLVIEDVSYADAPAVSIAEETITTEGRQVPIAFAVRYDVAIVDPTHRYQIRATIAAQDHLLFTSTTAYPVLTRGASTNVDIRLDQVQGNPSVTPPERDHPLTETHWRLVELNGKELTVGREQRGTLVLTEDGQRVSGFGGCNRLTGVYQLEANSLRFKNMASTMMACPDPLMTEEREFVTALSATESYRISGKTLELLNGKDEVVAWLHAIAEKH